MGRLPPEGPELLLVVVAEDEVTNAAVDDELGVHFASSSLLSRFCRQLCGGSGYTLDGRIDDAHETAHRYGSAQRNRAIGSKRQGCTDTEPLAKGSLHAEGMAHQLAQDVDVFDQMHAQTGQLLAVDFGRGASIEFLQHRARRVRDLEGLGALRNPETVPNSHACLDLAADRGDDGRVVVDVVVEEDLRA